jgi:predicted metal-dependent phosphoesterase TrpH
MYRIDLHTHSTASSDGGISRAHYLKALHNGILDCIAVTDHNTTSFARLLQQEFGERIIVGEEIMTTAGEIIGLYLDETIPGGLTPLETVQQIKAQGGITYIPHPFETLRKGLSEQTLDEISDYIDIIEVYNGRALLQNRTQQATVWSRLNRKLGAASSDAHGPRGLGRTFTEVAATPTQDNLLQLLQDATLHTGLPNVRALLYPKYHRLRNKLRRRSP